jgi:hypothetical protein
VNAAIDRQLLMMTKNGRFGRSFCFVGVGKISREPIMLIVLGAPRSTGGAEIFYYAAEFGIVMVLSIQLRRK